MANVEIEQPVPQQRPRKSWFGRNWWWVLLLVLIGGAIICTGICTGTIFFGVKVLKETAPYQMTLEAVRNDPTVKERLGEPIKDDWKVNVQINTSGDRGTALMNIPISGPKGTADVRSEAQQINGKWGLTTVEITFSNGDRHVIEITPDQTGDGLEDAPLYSPPPGEVGAKDMPTDANP